MKKNKFLALISALTIGAGAIGEANAQNLVLNGQFTANASQFLSNNGYLLTSGNPAITDWDFTPGGAGGGAGLNGTAVPAGHAFSPASAGTNTVFAFIQTGANELSQSITSFLPNTTYQLIFDAGCRSGEASDLFRVLITDDSQMYVTTEVGFIDLAANNSAFVHYKYTFTTPGSISGTPSIQLYNASTANGAVDFANMTVLIPVVGPPTVATQPVGGTRYVGGSLTLTAALNGYPDPQLQWAQIVSNTVMDIGGATNSVLVLTNVQLTDAGTYVLYATNSAGSTNTTPVTLTVLPNLVTNGDFTANSTLFVGSPGYALTAYHNPTSIPYWSHITGGNIGINGATAGAANNPGAFAPTAIGSTTFAFVENPGGLQQSLNLAPSMDYQLSFDAAARATFGGYIRVQIGDTNQLYVTTEVGTNDLTANNTKFVHYSYIFTTPATIAGTPNIQLNHISGGDAVDFANVVVVPPTVSAPAILTAPVGGTRDAGDPITFTAALSGYPVPQVQWYQIVAGVTNTINGATNQTLTLTNSQPADAGSYFLSATNSAGSTNTVPVVLIVAVGNVVANYEFLSNSAAFGGFPGYALTAYSNPTSIPSWIYVGAGNFGINGVNAGAANNPGSFGPTSIGGATYAFLQGSGEVAGGLQQVLPLEANTTYQLSFDASGRTGESANQPFRVSISDSSQVYVTTQIGTNDLGSKTAAFFRYTYLFTTPSTITGSPTLLLTNGGGLTIDFANLVVSTNPLPSAPAVISGPVGGTVYAGGTITLTAAVQGYPVPQLQWEHIAGGVTNFLSGATNQTLTLTNLQLSDAGSYILTAINSSGSASTAGVTVTVNSFNLTINSQGVVSWPTGHLQLATNVSGPWQTQTGAVSPYPVAATNGAVQFFRAVSP